MTNKQNEGFFVEEGSPEKPSSIALRVAAQQEGARAGLCVVFKS